MTPVQSPDSHGILARNWSSTNACTGKWQGITCKNGSLIFISLSGYQLRGPIDPLSSLTSSRFLIFKETGSTVAWIHGQIALLGFSGTIPAELASLKRLRLLRLNVSYNSLLESIPLEIRNITHQRKRLFSQVPGNKTIQRKRLTDYRDLGPPTQALGTFDGAAQTDMCGGGGTITLFDGRIYHFMAGLGRGTNNRAELLSLWTLLWTAKRLNCNDIKILGDSQAVIDWVNKKSRLRNNTLAHWYHRTLDLMDTFTGITISHHHREFNQMADTLSKAGLQVEEGYIKLREVSITDTGDWEILKIY